MQFLYIQRKYTTEQKSRIYSRFLGFSLIVEQKWNKGVSQSSKYLNLKSKIFTAPFVTQHHCILGDKSGIPRIGFDHKTHRLSSPVKVSHISSSDNGITISTLIHSKQKDNNNNNCNLDHKYSPYSPYLNIYIYIYS